jgi:hypothetical protein
MKKIGIATVTAALASLALAGTAKAVEPITSTDHLSFGTQTVGTTSSPQAAILNVPCWYVLDLGQYGGKSCTAPGRVEAIALEGDDFSLSHDCPLPIYNTSTTGGIVNCTITVHFQPTGEGAKAGVINISSYGDPDAYTVALDGTGVVPPSGGNGGTGGGGTAGGAAGATAPTGSTGPTKAKKCKKPRKAGKSKRCKKARR